VNTEYKIENKYLVNINFFILLISSVLWIFIIYFILGIKEYKEFYSDGGIVFNIVFVYLTVVINVSFLLALLASRWVKLALITFLIWSLFAFSLGVRGPALYPFAIGGAILISRKLIKLNYKRLIVGSLAFLSALSYKFLDRGGLDVDKIIDPLAAIQEMGGSLRPVYEVKSWINQGMDFYLGGTYLAPFDRQFNSVFKLKENLPSTVDDRLMNVMINNKSGPYGFSLIAEVFINFANSGVIVLGFMVGLFFKYLDSRISNKSVTPVLIVFAYGFFYHIRQSFASTFGTVVVGILYISILVFMSGLLNKIQKHSY
ncbi:O-antigen polysaccharide polymerase Wzy, partial [Psychrobacter sp. TAE2020]|uniref:O-antigen polysaccharide polymerase Wzy n=1 Tax=Psychrobacter sp. TAE2020 TaxID=2846762 RepID=UPI001C11F675